MAALGALPGYYYSYGSAINASGQVAGYSYITGNATTHAFLYTGTPGVDGQMIDLDAWLKANNPTEGAKWTLEYASGLTDTGLITGSGIYNDGVPADSGDRAFNPGNAPDTTGFGSVPYSYNIGKYDVTAGQYTAFLNAVASADTYGLYNSNMYSVLYGNLVSAITQSGSSGSYTYTDTGNPNYPLNEVTWGDAARFCNWLTNGQPTGAEGSGTTETGSYTLNGAITDAALNAVTRNANADYVIPTENEWYKAAYYNASSSSYYLYPTKSNSQPSNVVSATGTNNANYNDMGYTDPTNYLTAVGAFADSASPYGTYDQGGDVWQWNESVYFGSSRGMRGGSFYNYYSNLQSGVGSSDGPTAVFYNIGFRVSQVPEPASLGILGVGVMEVLVRRRRPSFLLPQEQI